MYTKPTYQSSDNDLNEVQRYGRTYDHVASLDNVKSLLRYDEVAAREWPYCADNTLPKIGTTPRALLQDG
ncbi:hypothetical protein GH877_30700, partial [Bacillus thuringiensis]|nr:hypothetical protein [Bacillus thuringiensis]